MVTTIAASTIPSGWYFFLIVGMNHLIYSCTLHGTIGCCHHKLQLFYSIYTVSHEPHTVKLILTDITQLKKKELGRMFIPLSPVPLFCKIHFLSKLYIPKHSDPCNASFKMNTVHVYLFAIIHIRWDIYIIIDTQMWKV